VQVLCSPASQSSELSEEEMWPHEPTAREKEAEVSSYLSLAGDRGEVMQQCRAGAFAGNANCLKSFSGTCHCWWNVLHHAM
jgi:hypothetical protein